MSSLQGHLDTQGQGMSKSASPAERRYLGRVAELGCCLCRHLGLGTTPAQIHHIKEGQGLSQRAEHWLAVPLCREHHLGESGLHSLGTKGFYTRYNLDELDLLAFTIEWMHSDQS